MRESFKRAVDFVIRQEVAPGHEQEGSLHTDPKDPGGTTCFGFAQRYQTFDVAVLQNNRQLAEQKMLELYWIPAGCDKLSSPLDIVHFDTAFNMGLDDASSFLKLSNGSVYDYIFLRLESYWKKKDSSFFKTWIRRVLNLRREVRKLGGV